jgi:hypothetical protein
MGDAEHVRNGNFREDSWGGAPAAAHGGGGGAGVGSAYRDTRSIGSAELPVIGSNEYHVNDLSTLQDEGSGGSRDDGWDPSAAAAAAAVASAAAAFLARGGISPEAFADIAKSALAAGNKLRLPHQHLIGEARGSDGDGGAHLKKRTQWRGDEEYCSSDVENPSREVGALPAAAAVALGRRHV